MTTLCEPASQFRASITLTVPSPVNPGPVRVFSGDIQAVPLQRLPLIAAIGTEMVICDKQRLPFRNGSILDLCCFGAFEYVIDDQVFMNEVARILAPGAPIEITLPNARGLGRLDRLNMFRYLRDTSGRSEPSPQLAEVGWRRHYDAAELTTMMIQAGFRNIRTQAVGLALGEPGIFRDVMTGHRARRHSRSSPFATENAASHVSGRFFVPAILGAQIVATGIRSE